MPLELVINADDLGLHPAIDRGILRCKRDGVLTSTTVLVTGRTAPEAIRAANDAGLGIGVHLCLSTSLRPASSASSIAPGGRFRRSWTEVVIAFARRQVRLTDVEEELRAQVALARKLGAKVDHLDGHQHLHALPGVAGIVRRIAREEKLPIRAPIQRPRTAWVRAPGAAVKASILSALSLATLRDVPQLDGNGTFEAGMLDEARLVELIRSLPDGRHEIGCHPGEFPGSVEEDPAWQFGWEREVAALTSTRVREALAQRGARLCTYGELFG
ncbi:MAG: carbohydrate deacetylase [Myxococcaceae bacterium]